RAELSYRRARRLSKSAQRDRDLPNRLGCRATTTADEPGAQTAPAHDANAPIWVDGRALPALVLCIPRFAAVGINDQRLFRDPGDRFEQSFDEPRRGAVDADGDDVR